MTSLYLHRLEKIVIVNYRLRSVNKNLLLRLTFFEINVELQSNMGRRK
jgi:hypothetical protein